MLSRRPTLAASMLTLAGAALVAAACTGGRVAPGQPQTDVIEEVPAEDWTRLASLRIVFGHQSVGSNILAGVADVMRAVPAVRLNVIESPAPPAGGEACLLHFRAGRNEHPTTKVDDFVRFVDAAGSAPPDIAFLKFCYIDANARTDVRGVFDHYRQAFSVLRSRYPSTTFVHLTMPLRVVQTGWKVPVKQLIGRPIGGYADNVKRHEYNELLRAEYGGKAPLFDLAAIESTRADGSRVSFTSGDRTYFALAPEYTDDGGHLNGAGRRLVAERLLVFLAEVAKARASGN